MTTVGVVLVAAGWGDRLDQPSPKALVELEGLALVAHSLDRLAQAGLPPPVVVHTPGWRQAFADAADGRPVAAWVEGGDTRTASVRLGVEAVGDVDLVAVHDAARALTPPDTIRRVVAAVTGDVVAAAPGRPVPDTLKRVGDGGSVTATVDRDGLVAVQTPQVFPREVLARALALGDDATDDLALVELLVARHEVDGRVVVVPGSPLGLKITFPDDLEVAARLVTAGG